MEGEESQGMAGTQKRTAMLVMAWATIVVVSTYRIVAQEVLGLTVSETSRSLVAGAIVVAGLVLTLLWPAVRPLRPFFGLFAVLVGVEWLVYTRVDQLGAYPRWLSDPSFSVYMLAEQSLRLIVTLAIIGYLFIVHRRREAFFLVRGDTAAPAGSVSWLGIKAGETWRTVGRNFAFFLSLGTLAFLVIAGRPRLDLVVRVLPFLPAVLLAAVLNAFSEEMTYKASFLSVLERAVGRQHALWLMAAFFGIGHFYGVPYGVVGVLLATFLGWFLGKSMLETRGVAWAWFLHFLQDVLIFTFMAIGSITPGGQ